jgi:hypothetical protein
MMPASDQFTERLVFPTHFLRIPSRQDITTLWAMRSENKVTGAIPAASISCVINHLISKAYAYKGRGLVSRRFHFSAQFRIDGEWRNGFCTIALQ